jgi:hypothetical protein
MSILQILIWAWVLMYIFVVLWYKKNPDFIDGYHGEFDFFDYNFFKSAVYIFSLITAPAIFSVLLVLGIKEFILIDLRKIKWFIKIMKIKDRDRRKELWKELKDI